MDWYLSTVYPDFSYLVPNTNAVDTARTLKRLIEAGSLYIQIIAIKVAFKGVFLRFY